MSPKTTLMMTGLGTGMLVVAWFLHLPLVERLNNTPSTEDLILSELEKLCPMEAQQNGGEDVWTCGWANTMATGEDNETHTGENLLEHIFGEDVREVLSETNTPHDPDITEIPEQDNNTNPVFHASPLYPVENTLIQLSETSQNGLEENDESHINTPFGLFETPVP